MLKTFGSDEVKFVFGGHTVSGFAEGDDAISMEVPDGWSESGPGADGHYTRNKMPVKKAVVKVKLQGSSASNDILSALFNADHASGSALLPAMLMDMSGTTVLIAGSGYIKKIPNGAFGIKRSNLEWEFHLHNITPPFMGGNN